MAFADTIQGLASRANVKVVRQSESYVQCVMGLPGGRTQMIHLLEGGDLARHQVVRISTPVTELPPGALPAEVAEGLLKANSTFKIGAFEIVEQGGKRILMFSHNMILDRLEPDELVLILAALATTGDEWEKKLGSGADVF